MAILFRLGSGLAVVNLSKDQQRLILVVDLACGHPLAIPAEWREVETLAPNTWLKPMCFVRREFSRRMPFQFEISKQIRDRASCTVKMQADRCQCQIKVGVIPGLAEAAGTNDDRKPSLFWYQNAKGLKG